MNYQPLHDRVVFEPYPFEHEQLTTGGLVVFTGNTNDDLDRGIVVAVGTGKPYDKGILPMNVEVGDVIIFNKRVPFKFFDAGKHYGILRESDIVLKTKK